MNAAEYPPYHILATYYEELSETRDWDTWIAYVDGIFRSAIGTRPETCLDAACGTGRIAVGLASLGYDVTGVDASESMLRQAREKAARAGFDIAFCQQDLRDLDLGRYFSAAVSLCDSLNYLVDPQDFARAVKNIADHLEPGGYFLFDVNTPWKLQNFYGDYTYAEHHEGFSYIWENEYDPAQRLVTMHLAFFVNEGNGMYRRYDEMHSQRAYTHTEIVAVLKEAKLELVDWGNIAGSEPPEPIEERVFYLTRRR